MAGNFLWQFPCRWFCRNRKELLRTLVDRVLGSLFLAASTPIMIVCAILVKSTSKGPVFYSQVRVGKNGRPFVLYKIRTMRHDCEAQSGPCWSVGRDLRVTWVGRLLRATHLDEL